jgi:pyrroline-5-carboxylate reductase
MKYGFLGCGNMGGAIARRLSESTKDIAVSDRSGKAKDLVGRLGLTYADNVGVSRDCDRIFLAVKPQMLRDVLAPLKPMLALRKPLLISMAAGVEIAQVEAMAGCALPVIRIMPNTPTAVGLGVIPYCRNALVTDRLLADWIVDMQPCGTPDPLEERLMDAASALSGSGPAYFYMMLDALADGAAACGMPKAKALDYAARTMAGAAQMYLETRQHPAALKDAVCSPGGSTLAGVAALEAAGFRSAVMDCVTAAYKRNKELGK